MDIELVQCLVALPGFVAQMEEHSQSCSDINLIEWFIMIIELSLASEPDEEMVLLVLGYVSAGLSTVTVVMGQVLNPGFGN